MNPVKNILDTFSFGERVRNWFALRAGGMSLGIDYDNIHIHVAEPASPMSRSILKPLPFSKRTSLSAVSALRIPLLTQKPFSLSTRNAH